MASAARSTYRPSPAMVARYPWVNKADTKFNAKGLFKVDGVMNGPEALAFKALIDKVAEDALAAHTEDMTPGERKKWSIYLPYEVEEDDQGNPTGDIHFQFRQNATILVEGEEKAIKIAIYDSQDKPTEVPVYGGSILRVMYKLRPIVIASTKKAGVRMDFLKVQVVKLADRTGGTGDGGFGSVEGGYVDEHEAEGGFSDASEGTSSPNADY
jgi:hypothetical protein